MIDAIDEPRFLTLPLDVRTERVSAARATRILRRAAPLVRRLERAQQAVLTGTAKALG
jgi:hypothetical protein